MALPYLEGIHQMYQPNPSSSPLQAGLEYASKPLVSHVAFLNANSPQELQHPWTFFHLYGMFDAVPLAVSKSPRLKLRFEHLEPTLEFGCTCDEPPQIAVIECPDDNLGTSVVRPFQLTALKAYKKDRVLPPRSSVLSSQTSVKNLSSYLHRDSPRQ